LKIGYYVQGTVDEAFVCGVVDRYCPHAKMQEGLKRGRSKETLRREIKKALTDLVNYKSCDYVVVLTDSDELNWQEVYKNEWEKVPEQYKHLTVFGVADRNIECWLALDHPALAQELGCSVAAIPLDNPSGFIKRKFGLTSRDAVNEGKRRIREFVTRAPFHSWLATDKSFEHFWNQIWMLSKHGDCLIPNERDEN